HPGVGAILRGHAPEGGGPRLVWLSGRPHRVGLGFGERPCNALRHAPEGRRGLGAANPARLGEPRRAARVARLGGCLTSHRSSPDPLRQIASTHFVTGCRPREADDLRCPQTPRAWGSYLAPGNEAEDAFRKGLGCPSTS